MVKMGQIKKAKDLSYNAIFYSAFKALVVFEMLLHTPKTLEEISQSLMNTPYIKSKISNDTLRVYINSFKKAGCYVERKLTGEKHRQYSYFIPENPFKPKVSEAQVKILFDLYDMIVYNLPFEQVLNVDLLYRKFDSSFQNEQFHDEYEEHSLLKRFDINLLRQLEQCCKVNALVTVLYDSPRSGLKEIPIIAHRLKLQNYKLYLEGFGKEYNNEGIFLVSRIKKVIEVTQPGDFDKTNSNELEIICEFYDASIQLLENETLLSEENGVRRIKHITGNKVLTQQRFLQLTDRCKIIEPIEFRNDFINLLKSAREGYADGV